MLTSALHGFTTEVGHISIDNDFYYQPYSDNDPYFVGYADMDDDTIPPEGIEYKVCKTKKEADQVADYLIKAAESYNKSLLKPVYSFTEYLDFMKDLDDCFDDFAEFLGI